MLCISHLLQTGLRAQILHKRKKRKRLAYIPQFLMIFYWKLLIKWLHLELNFQNISTSEGAHHPSDTPLCRIIARRIDTPLYGHWSCPPPAGLCIHACLHIIVNLAFFLLSSSDSHSSSLFHAAFHDIFIIISYCSNIEHSSSFLP